MAGRRTNGDGKLRRRPDGRWECTIMDGYKPDGRKNFKSFYGRTKTEAQTKKNQYLLDKQAGLVVEKQWTFSEFADFWFENHADNVTATTREGYTYTLRILKNEFNRRKLKDIKAHDIEKFLKKLRNEGKSTSYLSKCRAMLFQIFRKAVANDILQKNPVEYAEKTRTTGQQQRRDAFTSDEENLLMNNLPQNKIGWSIRLMLGTGMRTQELLALQPRHIAEDGSYIIIEQAVVMEKGTVAIGCPKSRDSTRVIPVPSKLRYCARLLRTVNTKFIWEAGKEDTPCNPSYFRKLFKAALQSVDGVRILTPHSCRHTFASNLLKAGIDNEVTRILMGHATYKMSTHYMHVPKAMLEAAMDVYNNRLVCDDVPLRFLEFGKSS